MITSVDREVTLEVHYLAKRICEMKSKFPMTEAPNPKGVEKFAVCLRKRMTQKRSTLAFNRIKHRGPGKETEDFLNYHGLGEYIQAIYNYHEGGKMLNKE